MKKFFEKILLCGLVALVVSACSDTASQDYKNPGGVPEECLENPEDCATLIIIPADKDPSKDPDDDSPTEISSLAGEMVDFEWKQTLPWYYESVNHLYGFDKDPLSNNEKYKDAGKYVYVSVATDEIARVLLKIDPNARSVFRLNAVDDANNVVMTLKSGDDICADDKCEREIELPAGKYAIYYGDEDIERYLEIVEYEKKSVNADYYQFDGDDACSDDGCYSFEKVKMFFDNIYGQVVLNSSEFISKKPSDLLYDDQMVVDLTEPIGNDFFSNEAKKIENIYIPGFNEAKQNYLDYAREHSADLQRYNQLLQDECTMVGTSYSCPESVFTGENQMLKTVYESYISLYDEYRAKKIGHDGIRVVLAINSMRLMWRLKGNTTPTTIHLNNLNEFAISALKTWPVNKMFVKSLSSECSDGVGVKPKPIVATVVGYSLETESVEISIVDESGKEVSFSPDCDVIYVDNVTDVPGTISVAIKDGILYSYKSAAQRTLPFINLDNVVSGGIVWAGKKDGKASLHTILHEIGHTLGLSDVFINYEDGTVPYDKDAEITYFEDGMINLAYHLGYMTKETDLMNYQYPAGPRLRYRNLPVVSTGTNNRIEKGGEWVTENQWACIRNNLCYNNESKGD